MSKDPTHIAQGKRLKEARSRLFKTATDAQARLKHFSDVSLPNYIQHENGSRSFRLRAEEYAKAFEVSAAWLIWGDQAEKQAIEFKVLGQVGAGGEGNFDSAYEVGDGESLFFMPDEVTMVLEINGRSMEPRYRHRDKVLFGYRYDDPTSQIGVEVMAQLKNNGRKLFKVLKPGTRKGLWNLESINDEFEVIRDVEIDWVCPVKWVKV
jgi:hypothetical protein